MPKLNRRHFLQVAGAASLAPAIPALPASVAAVPTGATSAQMMWASLFARAGNVPNFASLTRTMGVPSNVARNIYAKLLETNVVAVHGAQRLARAPRPVPAGKAVGSRRSKLDIRKVFADHDDSDLVDEEAIEEVDSVEVEPIVLANEDPAGV